MALENVRTMAEKGTARRGYRIPEIAKMYGVSDGFIRKEIRAGRLKQTKLGAATIVLAEDLQRWESGEKQAA
jgi:transposase